MTKIDSTIISFFHKQPYTIVTTIDKNGVPHNSCKGVVDIEVDGKVYLLDVYKGNTYQNLKVNHYVNITAVDEHKFIGYCLKGTAKIVKREDVKDHIVKAWETKITKRISSRLIKNLKGEKGHCRHPEAMLPSPEYLIEADIKDIVDLTPHNIKSTNACVEIRD